MTLPPSTLELIKAALALYPGVSSVAADETVAGSLRVVASTGLHEWTLRIDPQSGGLPDVRVLETPLIGRLAHVNHAGIVCVTDHEGLSVDLSRPADLVTFTLGRALAELDRSLEQHRLGDYAALLEEFEGYWFSLPRARAVDVHLELDAEAREVVAFLDEERQCLAFTDRRQVQEHVAYAPLERLTRRARERALYIPFATPILPPTPSEPLDSQRVRNGVFDAIDAPTRAALEKLLKSWPRRATAHYLLLSQPRPAGRRAAFGVQFIGRGGRHPLLEPSGRLTSRPLFVRRHHHSDVRPRGGANAVLAQQHVAIAGCGAVGARIAEALALAGVGRLTLIDPERLESDNLYRHLLGGEACGYSKAHALAAHLRRRLPQIEVQSEYTTLSEWATRPRLATLDGLVLAIGKPHLERAFIRETRTWSELHAVIVTTWLEPLGLGGHVQRTLPGVPGCLECLYTEPDGIVRLAPRPSYAEPGQAFSRNLTGCVGAFTPYSVLDATQTALLATRALTDALTGDRTSTYRAWRGEDREFVAAGLVTTPWYRALDEARLQRAAIEYSRVPCKVCGGTR